MQQRYIFKEDLRKFQDCPRKGWYGLGEGSGSKDQDPFLEFLGEEARSVKTASVELFEDVLRTNGSLEERARRTRDAISDGNDFVLFEPRLISGEFVAKPSYLIRKNTKLFVLQVAAKAGDELAHREGRLLVTYYGNVRSEWKELVQGLAYSCEVLRGVLPGVDVSPWLVLPSSCRGIGERERSFVLGDAELGTYCEAGPIGLDVRRRESVLRFFDASEAVDLIQHDVAESMGSLKRLLASKAAPEPKLRYACRNCEYRIGKAGDGFSQCWGKLARPKPHLFDLHQLYSLKNGKGLLADSKINEGKTSLFDVSEKDLHGIHRDRQIMQLRCARSGMEWIDPQLFEEMGRLQWPIRFVDFETYQSALPWIEGAKPFELIPFQWSCHVLHQDGRIDHEEWLHDGRGDARRDFVESLHRTVGSYGSLLIYTDYEIQVLDTVRKHFIGRFGHSNREAEWIGDLLCSGRIVDQHNWVMKYFCHPLMGGRTSLKKALPAAWLASEGLGSDARFREYFSRDGEGSLVDPYLTLPEVEISGVKTSVREGCGAMKAYRELAIGSGRSDPIAKARLQSLMLAYCRLDTAAQAILFEHWRNAQGRIFAHGNKKNEALQVAPKTKK